MGGLGGGAQNDDDMEGSGLIERHAYTMIRVLEWPSDGKVLRLVKLRNPHGRNEWKGRWSDKSDVWDQYPDLKDQVGLEADEDDGTFWMSFHDCSRFFSSFYVVKKSMPT